MNYRAMYTFGVCEFVCEELTFRAKEGSKGRIQKKTITKIVNMVLSEVGGVAAFH